MIEERKNIELSNPEKKLIKKDCITKPCERIALAPLTMQTESGSRITEDFDRTLKMPEINCLKQN